MQQKPRIITSLHVRSPPRSKTLSHFRTHVNGKVFVVFFLGFWGSKLPVKIRFFPTFLAKNHYPSKIYIHTFHGGKHHTVSWDHFRLCIRSRCDKSNFNSHFIVSFHLLVSPSYPIVSSHHISSSQRRSSLAGYHDGSISNESPTPLAAPRSCTTVPPPD